MSSQLDCKKLQPKRCYLKSSQYNINLAVLDLNLLYIILQDIALPHGCDGPVRDDASVAQSAKTVIYAKNDIFTFTSREPVRRMLASRSEEMVLKPINRREMYDLQTPEHIVIVFAPLYGVENKRWRANKTDWRNTAAITAREETHWVVEVECHADGGLRQCPLVRKNGISNMMTTCQKLSDFRSISQYERDNLPISALASGALGERKSERRIMLPQVANPYLESLRIETPTINTLLASMLTCFFNSSSYTN